jgi:hypothetical protein
MRGQKCFGDRMDAEKPSSIIGFVAHGPLLPVAKSNPQDSAEVTIGISKSYVQ